MANRTPVILLAFANDRKGSFLRSIASENQRLSEILRKLEDERYAELIVLPDASLSDILRVFKEKRDRIQVFHYGGHADSYGLLMRSGAGEEQVADAESFANFLGQQARLKLVFLNGCSTHEQHTRLIENGVGYVIATSQAINDRTAQEFSEQFYHSLSSGAAVAQAFTEASEGVKASVGGNPRSLYWAEAQEARPEGLPWELHQGATADKTWHLRQREVAVVVDRVVELVGKDRVETALKTLGKYLKEQGDDQNFRDLTSIVKEFKSVQRQARIGVLSYSEITIANQKVAHKLMDLAASLKGEAQGTSELDDFFS